MSDNGTINLVRVLSSVDNIDFLEDTPYGHSTLHGTLIVVNQKEDKDAEPVNTPLDIPDKPPSSPLHVHIRYKDEPVLKLTPIKFTSFAILQWAVLLKLYCQYDETWVLANHMANNIDEITLQNRESPDIITAPTPDNEFAPSRDDTVMCPIPDILTLRNQAPESDDITSQNTLLHVTQKERKKES